MTYELRVETSGIELKLEVLTDYKIVYINRSGPSE